MIGEVRRGDEAMERISLETADRAVALLTAQAPLLPSVGSDPDAYTTAFTRLYDGVAVQQFRFVLDERDDDEARVVAVWIDEETEHYVRRGSLRVTADDDVTVAASVAHLFLLDALDVTELEALAADPDGWAPSQRLPASLLDARVRRAKDALALDTRSRGWAVMGSSMGVLCGVAVLGLGRLGMGAADQRPLAVLALQLLAWGLLGGFLLVGCARRLLETLWLEPRARALAIGDDGFRDPQSGRRVRWEDVVSVRRRLASITWTLSDGRTFTAPRSWFMSPDEALAELSRRARGKSDSPYRGRGLRE